MTPQDINISDFNYPLDPSRIAQHPCEPRDACKLLVRGANGRISDRRFAELPSLLSPDTLLVCNNTRVINARIHFRKETGAVIEIFCLEPQNPVDYAESFGSTHTVEWKCFVGNSKRWREGSLSRMISLPEGQLTLTATRTMTNGKASFVKFEWDNPAVTFSTIVESIGEIPIPPYLNRESEPADETDYQTVFSSINGSVAAPTAGLHFTPALLEALARRGVERRELTLHVGAGTFQPVQTSSLGEHKMHSEWIEVSLGLIEELAATDRKIVAVGTTSVRTLESLYHFGLRAIRGETIDVLPQWTPYVETDACGEVSRREALSALAREMKKSGLRRLVASTSIIIAPGYTYEIVDGIITNFHQPCSTLLLLVSAFIGNDWREMYQHALDSDYRFLSYGDAMLLLS